MAFDDLDFSEMEEEFVPGETLQTLQRELDQQKPKEEEVKAPEPVRLVSLLKRRLIPIGRDNNLGKPFLLPFPKMTDATYNVFACVAPMGSGKTTIFRNLIYWIKKMEPASVFFLFDPMMLEFSELGIQNDTPEKREHLLNEVMRDPQTHKLIRVEVKPDSIPVFHVVPRYAIMKIEVDPNTGKEVQTFDRTTLEIIRKHGGQLIAEDVSSMKEEEIFNILNYDEVRTNTRVHFYLRRAIKYCNEELGYLKWFPPDLIQALKIRGNMSLEDEEPTLTTTELELIEKLEKYSEDGFFMVDEREKKLYSYDLKAFVKTGKIINFSFMAFKKTERHGEDVVKGHTDYLLQKIINISNEYYDALRKRKFKLPLTEDEMWLLDNWKVSMAFEESEIFLPPVDTDLIKTRPCLRRLEYMMSLGRKFGFKNFLMLTQRMSKMNKMLWEEATHMFIGPIIGEQRDLIIKNLGLDKVVFQIADKNGLMRPVHVRDLVSILKKDEHEWVFIDKNGRRVGMIKTFDAPVG